MHQFSIGHISIVHLEFNPGEVAARTKYVSTCAKLDLLKAEVADCNRLGLCPNRTLARTLARSEQNQPCVCLVSILAI